MGVAETEALVARLKGGVGKAITEDREPADAELVDLIDLVGGMAINLARIAEREPQTTVTFDPAAIAAALDRADRQRNRKA